MRAFIEKIKDLFARLTGEACEEAEIECYTCDDTRVVVVNAGYCGGCERCGSTEEKEVPCPDCAL